jgi:hypothetical protein
LELVQPKASGGFGWLLSLEQVTVCVLAVKDPIETTGGAAAVADGMGEGEGDAEGDGDGDGEDEGDGEGDGDALGVAEAERLGLVIDVAVFRVISSTNNTITAISSAAPAMIRIRMSREPVSSVSVGVALRLARGRVGASPAIPSSGGTTSGAENIRVGASPAIALVGARGAENIWVGASPAGTSSRRGAVASCGVEKSWVSPS